MSSRATHTPTIYSMGFILRKTSLGSPVNHFSSRVWGHVIKNTAKHTPQIRKPK